MKYFLIILIFLAACSKEMSYTGNCGRVVNKIHETGEFRNEIWFIAVAANDSTERLIGIDSSTFEKIKIGDKYCQ